MTTSALNIISAKCRSSNAVPVERIKNAKLIKGRSIDDPKSLLKMPNEFINGIEIHELDRHYFVAIEGIDCASISVSGSSSEGG